MKRRKYADRYLLDFFMQSNSLNDLLEILETICINLELDYLNHRTKHFKYFKYTFFGLMERVKGILESMLFRAEPLIEKYTAVAEVYNDLRHLRNIVNETDILIRENKMREAKEKIIEISQEYSKIFIKINRLIEEI